MQRPARPAVRPTATEPRRHQPGRGSLALVAEDEVLIEQIRAGDSAAFERMFEMYYGPLCDFALGYLRSRDAAEELVQEVFCRVWTARASWRVTRGARAYLYGAVRNRALNAARDRRLQQGIESTAAAIGWSLGASQHSRAADASTDVRELAEVLAEAVRELPARCREALLLCREHELTYDEAAAAMHTSPRTVKNQIAQALRVLRDAVAAWRG